MKRVILTGGSGFIGRNLRESFLSEKYELLAPTRSEMNLLDEHSVQSFFKKNPCDVLIHSAIKPANRAASDLNRIMSDNSIMFFNILHNEEAFGKLIHLGSGSGYDMRYYKPKIKEVDFGEHIPIDELGLYKYMVGKYAEFSSKIIDLRLFGIYGKYEDYSIRFISNMICKAILGLPLTMKQDRKFDYLFVDDFPKILEYFIDKKPKFSAYNITPDSSIALSQIAQSVLDIGGYNLPIEINSPCQGLEYSGDNSRLKQEIESIQFTELDEGIQKLFSYYRDNKDIIDPRLLEIDK